ncbi:MAG TPA: c-type cytochrome [Usitatibacter sp.]|jgi:cytochrome c553|nr:c-type cytochrome [Usitatibacter sp.]
MRVALLAAVVVSFTAAAQQQPAPQPDPDTQKLAQVCGACHGADGNSPSPQYPVLAGQSWRYTYNELRDYKEKRRDNPVMSPFAANLTRDQMIALGNYYAAQKPRPVAFQADAARVEAGRKIADAALCPMCHLGGFVGQNEIPRVAGQWPQYVKQQLADFRARRRTNDAGNMTSIARNLSDEDIENLAQYIANLS